MGWQDSRFVEMPVVDKQNRRALAPEVDTAAQASAA
jgi:hypothetical protein